MWLLTRRTKYLAGWVCLGLILTVLPHEAAARYIQLEGVADVKTRYSNGCFSVRQVADLAGKNKIDVVLFGDYARDSLEYGFFPFKSIFKKKEERSSVLVNGANVYLSEINGLDKTFRETLLIPAVEVAPFYFWSGSIWDKTLVAHNWDKHLFIVGLANGAEMEQLPLLNSNLSWRYVSKFQNAFWGYVLLFLVSLAVVYHGFRRRISVPLMIFFLFLTLDNHPFRSSPFDPYHGDLGIRPYQEVIDYAVYRDALVFWNHLESVVDLNQKGSAGSQTLPHPEDLILSNGYTGFQALGRDGVTLNHPGKEWDQVLMQFIQGTRAHPVWGYGGDNYNCDEVNGQNLGAVRTVFLVREKTRDAVLEAMRKGRMYAARRNNDFRLSLDRFTLNDEASGKEATMGEELRAADYPVMHLKIRSLAGGGKPVTIRVVRNGKAIREEAASLPYEMKWKDVDVERKGRVYYRVMVFGDGTGQIMSNPVFVRFDGARALAASLPQARIEDAPIRPPAPPRVESPVGPQAALPESPSTSVVPAPKGPPSPTAAPRPVSPPAVSPVTPPELPKASPGKPDQKYVRVRAEGVTLKKGPGEIFPEAGKVGKGERLLFVRRTTIMLNGKVWLVVKRDGRLAYVWEGLVEFENGS